MIDTYPASIYKTENIDSFLMILTRQTAQTLS